VHDRVAVRMLLLLKIVDRDIRSLRHDVLPPLQFVDEWMRKRSFCHAVLSQKKKMPSGHG
jgi:hypothetical protein